MAGSNGSIFQQGTQMDLWITTLCLILVVAITTVLEFVLHSLEHWINTKASDMFSACLSDVLQKLYKELMILGLISFVLTMLLQAGAVSNQTQILSFEYAHIVIFFMAMALIFQALSTICSATVFKQSCLRSQKLELSDLETKVAAFSGRRLPLRLHFDVMFKLLSVCFIQTNRLPADLNFGAYYCMVQDKVVVSTMDIDLSSWMTFICILLGNVGLHKWFIPSSDSTTANSANSTGSNVSAENTVEFAVVGWVLTGGMVFALIWAVVLMRKIVIYTYSFVESQSDVDMSMNQVLIAADQKVREYRKASAIMNSADLTDALNEIGRRKQSDEIKETLTDTVAGRWQQAARRISNLQPPKRHFSSLRRSPSGRTRSIKELTSTSTQKVIPRTSPVAMRDSICEISEITEIDEVSSTAENGVSQARTNPTLRTSPVPRINEVQFTIPKPYETTKPIAQKHSSPATEAMLQNIEDAAALASSRITMGARVTALSRISRTSISSVGGSVAFVGGSATSSSFSARKGSKSSYGEGNSSISLGQKNTSAQARTKKHIDLLQKYSNELVHSYEMGILTYIINVLTLLNCTFMAVFICTFAVSASQIESGLGLVLLGILPPVLNLIFLAPLLNVLFSIISAVCNLDTGLLGTVLERDTEINNMLFELKSKIARRLKKWTNNEAILKSAFQQMDVDGSGTIDKGELRAMLHGLKIYLSNVALDRLFNFIDADHSGEVEYAEFASAMNLYSTNADITKVKSQIRKDLDGKSRSEHQEYLRALKQYVAMG